VLPLSREYFVPDKRRASGYGSQCKICNGNATTYGIHLVRIQEIAQDGFKYCNKCLRELPATTDYFYSEKRAKSRFSSHCKECKGQIFGETKFNPHVTETTKKGYYICRCCKEELPLNNDHFNILSASPTGYNCYCKKCNRIKEKHSVNTNIEKYRAHAVFKSQKRRNLKRGLLSTFSGKDLDDCLKFFDNKDAYTGLAMGIISQDHVTPVTSGGSYVRQNIVPCEKSINSSKSNSDMETWYRKQSFFDEKRLNKIYKWIGYSNGIQQLSLL